MAATWTILAGDCRDQLATLPDRSVQTVVTSPPYFGLRDYGHDGQIGLEPTPDEFVAALVDVFREVRRVLRDDGTVWLNLGDSYADRANRRSDGLSWRADRRDVVPAKRNVLGNGVKQKDLIGIPWMVAFALRADGWYLRSDIIWAKPNPMPESVTDRPTKAHEYVFLLSKGPRYYYDADAIREDYARGSVERIEAGFKDRYSEVASGGFRGAYGGPNGEQVNPSGRNKRSVWTIATQPYPGAHFATFPPKLIEPCILAGSAPKACGECGAPWRRLAESRCLLDGERPVEGAWKAPVDARGSVRSEGATGVGHWRITTERETVGWESSCDHQDDTGHSVVLDPFAGAGTTGLVALRHGRSFVGCELNAEYVRLARDRIIADAPLLNVVAEATA